MKTKTPPPSSTRKAQKQRNQEPPRKRYVHDDREARDHNAHVILVQTNPAPADEGTCSMASYKRLEAHYRNEQKMRKYIEQAYDEAKRVSDSQSQGTPPLRSE